MIAGARNWIHLALIVALTVLTQIGGLAYLAALGICRRCGWRRPALGAVTLMALYSLSTFAAQLSAPLFGRVPLSCFVEEEASLAVQNPLYCVLNRNYVTPAARDAVKALADHMMKSFPGAKTLVLDANFPFIDGFPLLPHLSHKDGRKIDIAFYYKNDAGYLAGSTRSPIGYFAFEQPAPGDDLPCAARSDWFTLRWDFDWMQNIFPGYSLERERTREALRWLSDEGQEFGIEKIFVEPHVASELGVTNQRIRFQGCRAARHDDHIHFQVR